MKHILVIGGGFFGLYLSEFMAKKGYQVTLVEREGDLMQRASYVNQARVHNGYHYPRSVLTALRSRVAFPKFVEEFRDCIVSDFDKYYLIGNALSKVTAKQFQMFCDKIRLPCERDSSLMDGLLNPSMIEASFLTKEYAFDSIKLKESMLDRVNSFSNIVIQSFTEVLFVEKKGEKIYATLKHACDEKFDVVGFDQVFNCTYSGINFINKKSNLPLVSLKHEMTEMCLVNVPKELKDKGITLMCGPFFSVMPFPSEGLHSFSHVRYTPHYEWGEGGQNYVDAHSRYLNDRRNSAWSFMLKDAKRYIPILDECEYKKSLWDVKTILPRSDDDDSRPILFMPNHHIKGYHCIMGGKIDNVYDVIDSIQKKGLLG